MNFFVRNRKEVSLLELDVGKCMCTLEVNAQCSFGLRQAKAPQVAIFPIHIAAAADVTTTYLQKDMENIVQMP